MAEINWRNRQRYLYCINQTSDGGFILGGMSRSDISGDKSENSIGFLDFWIIKTDVQGDIQWLKIQ